jgi:hypothetical protein
MIGTTVQATLWQVEYRYLSAAKEKPEEPRGRVKAQGVENPIALMMAAQIAAAEAAEARNPYMTGRAFVLTADPSGADLVAVARTAVLGYGEPAHDFSLISAQRVADSVKGLAIVSGARA